MNPEAAIVIVGAGFAGLCMAIELKQAGIDAFTIYEANAEVGGTWRDNVYPGCACDIPSHLYSFSFELKSNWSRTFSPRAEIQEYLVECATKYDLYSQIVFNTEIRAARFDEARGLWTLHTADGEAIMARAVVLGVGGLSRPRIPEFEGLQSFGGQSFHSARWNHDVDLRGKRVAVVGTGASAIQIVPAIADEVEQLSVFQRTPPWVVPRMDRAYSGLEKRLFAGIPGLQRAYRSAIYWFQESRAIGFLGEQRMMDLFEWFARRYIERAIDDLELRARVTPDYTIGCKRILVSDDYYPALARPNVELVAESVVRFTPDGLVASDGVEHALDVVIFATGFRVTDFLAYFEVIGRDGRNLNAQWQGGAEAYYGVAVTGFPNLFMLVGPNTGLGHNSIVFMIESQARLVRQAIEAMQSAGASSIEVRPGVQRDFNEAVQQRSQKTVWQSGCQSWYLEDSGKNTTLWPGYTFEYWLRTRKLRGHDFRLNWERDEAG
ncbi:MAG: NAD(P)/FAD-dependent oxidoreductase [Bradymonadaceae bacterium]|nr:NAD(P)/FAD-dependent oxidoreductase [Lujinxingiaceae bacterium]